MAHQVVVEKYSSAFTIVVLWGKRGGPAPALGGGGPHYFRSSVDLGNTTSSREEKDPSAVAIVVLWGRRWGPVPTLGIPRLKNWDTWRLGRRVMVEPKKISRRYILVKNNSRTQINVAQVFHQVTH